MLPPHSIATDDHPNETLPEPMAAPDSAAPWEATRSAGATLSSRKVPLGEELPVFCERCGYCLHGVAQQVCTKCSVRQFQCPECGHHQPINTLRPAAQKILGRLRAFFLTLSMLFRINFFGWLLFAWVGMGYSWSYGYNRDDYMRNYSNPTYGPRELTSEQVFAFTMFALAFSMFGRMLLLRWRRGYKVGLVLAGLVCVAIALGAMWRKWEWESRRWASSSGWEQAPTLPFPFAMDFLIEMAITAVAVIVGASIVWGIWSALAHVFLPKRTSEALLDWQRSQSNESASSLARSGPTTGRA
jgi:hypothetical protein